MNIFLCPHTHSYKQMRKQLVRSCVYTGTCTCEYRRASKRRAFPHPSEPREEGLGPPQLPSPQTSAPRRLSRPPPGCCTWAGKEMTAHQSRQAPGCGPAIPGWGRGAGWKCAIRPHQRRASHVSCPSGQALTTQTPWHPKEPQDMVRWAGWCLGAGLPSPGQKQKDPRKSRTPLWQLWRTSSLHFSGKRGFGGAEGCGSSSTAPTSTKPSVPMRSWDALW